MARKVYSYLTNYMQTQPFQSGGNFEPSVYQESIFRFQEEDTRDAFVNAKAGSGKTTTLIQCAERLSASKRERAIFVAFNRHIADELADKLPEGVTARTIHSLGREAISNYVKPSNDWKVERYKYQHLARMYAASIGLSPDSPAGKVLTKTIEQIMGFIMVTLINPTDKEALQAIAAHYDIIVEDWATIYDAIPKLLTWGFIGADTPDDNGRRYSIDECVSFDEMLYLPAYLELPIAQYDMIYCDEAQDLSASQLEIILKMRSPGGRIIFVGDPNQAIYGFAGADSRSIKTILERTHAVELPLSICYRCPKSHIRLAHAIVPEIETHAAAEEGSIEEIDVNRLATSVRAGDLILCRTTAPLVTTALQLIESHISAKVRGHDIETSLINLLDSVEKMADFTFTRFAEFLELYRGRMVEGYRQKDFSELAVESLNDRVHSLFAIFRRCSTQGKVATVASFRANIKSIFSDEQEAVTFCTVHRAKGLEADRVFILEENQMPHPKATKSHEIDQEWNLRYVALTRAKKALYFVRNQIRINTKNEAQIQVLLNQYSQILTQSPDDQYAKGCICLEMELFGLAVVHFRKALLHSAHVDSALKLDEADAMVALQGTTLAETVDSDCKVLNEIRQARDAKNSQILNQVVDSRVRQFPSFSKTTKSASDSKPSGSQDVDEGDEVNHAHFGIGRVLSVEPLTSIANIDFETVGIKRILASWKVEIISRGQVYLEKQEQAKIDKQAMELKELKAFKKAEKIRAEAEKIRAETRTREREARIKEHEARWKEQEPLRLAHQAKEKAQEVERKAQEAKAKVESEARAKAEAEAKAFGRRVVSAWKEAWKKMDHPDTFGHLGTDISFNTHHGFRSNYGKREAPQIQAIQERESHLFIVASTIVYDVEIINEEAQIIETREGGVPAIDYNHTPGTHFARNYYGFDANTVRIPINVEFHENYQFNFEERVVTVIFEKLQEPEKEYVKYLNKSGWLKQLNLTSIIDHPF